ncbi:MAG: hypothetical protein IH914_11085 [candidate division Zixibacteria bacterium]|nr:hypothetical protein [candidate division Zixibacteria bacterium]
MKRLFTAVLLSGIILGSTPNVTGQVCGDANGDGAVNIADVTFLIARIFAGGPPPPP